MIIKLSVRQELYDADDGTARLQAWISEAPEEYDHKMFVYQHSPVPPESDTPEDKFVNIASYAEMYAFPPDAPADGIPFYRDYQFDLLFNDETLMRESLTMTEQFLKQLVKDMATKDDIPAAEVVVEVI